MTNTVPTELDLAREELAAAYGQLASAGETARQRAAQLREVQKDRETLAAALFAALEAGLPPDVAEQAREALGGPDG